MCFFSYKYIKIIFFNKFIFNINISKILKKKVNKKKFEACLTTSQTYTYLTNAIPYMGIKRSSSENDLREACGMLNGSIEKTDALLHPGQKTNAV
jgi:hypothetical protein